MSRVCSEYDQRMFKVCSEYVQIVNITSSSASSVSVFGLFFHYSHNRWAIISLYSRILRSRTDAVRKFSHVGAEETQLQFKELVPCGTLGKESTCALWHTWKESGGIVLLVESSTKLCEVTLGGSHTKTTSMVFIDYE